MLKDWEIIKIGKRKKMKKEITEKKYRNHILLGIILMIGGFILIFMGIFIHFLGEPKEGINLSTQQPVIIDGTKEIIFGLILTVFGVYKIRLTGKNFTIKRKIEFQEKLDNYSNYLMKSGYGQREIKKRTKKYLRNIEKEKKPKPQHK